MSLSVCRFWIFDVQSAAQTLQLQFSPVFPRLLLEELVKLQHLLPGDDVNLEFGQHLVHQPQVVVDQAFPVSPHVTAGAPEDEDRVLAGVEQLMATPQDSLHAGVSDDAQRGAAAHVTGVTPGCGGVVHSDDAFCLVNLIPATSSDEVTGAGHQGARLAVHSQRLSDGRKKRNINSRQQNFPLFGLVLPLVEEQQQCQQNSQLLLFTEVRIARKVLFSTDLHRMCQGRQKYSPEGM